MPQGVLSLRAISNVIRPTKPWHLPDSPVPYLLQSNEPPTDEEVLPIQEVLSVVGSYRGNLRMDGYNAAKFVSQHQSILSAIRRLPPEILEIIFIHVASSPSLSLSAERKERHYICDLPWNVSQVSLLWRRVALSTPTLWSQLPTVDLDQSLSAAPEYVEFLTELVERSRNGPLDVHIHARSLSNQRLPLLHLLLTQSSRWRRARLEVRLASLPSIFESIKGRLSSLEELVLNIWSRSRIFGLVTVNLFEQAPQLRRVALSGYSEVRVLLPSGCLEDYWQGSIAGGQIHVALSSSSSMKILSAIHLPESRIPWSPTVIPYLTALRIRFLQFSDPESFLYNLTLPSVEELQLTSHTNILPSVLSLTARAGRSSALKKLFLKCPNPTPHQLTELLKQVPLLTHIHVTLPPIEDIHFLETGNGLPLLQLCEFDIEGDHELMNTDIRQLKSLAVSRCEIASTLPIGSANEGGLTSRIRVIYIHFGSIDSEPRQKLFHDWPTTETTTRLIHLKETLISQIPEVYRFETNPMKVPDPWDTPSHTLLSIENINGITGQEIYESGIHHTIHRLISWSSSECRVHKFSSSAKRILEKWDLALKADLHKVRWVIKDKRSLVYLSSFNTIRLRSANEAVKIAFGVKDSDIDPSDACWHPFYDEN